MGIFAYFLVILLGFASDPAAAVFGGNEAEIEEYPHQASIEERTNLGLARVCSGAILSDTIIVTLASAIERFWDMNDIVVRVGSSKTTSYGSEYNVSEVHPAQHGLDVAVLKLKTPITWSMKVHSITLPRVGYRPRIGSTAFISSWGDYEQGIATKLRHAALKVVGQRCCNWETIGGCGRSRNVSETFWGGRLLCLSNFPNRGTCNNDDGAPLVENGALIGLATPCGFGCRNDKGESQFLSLSQWRVRYFLEQFL